MSLGPENSQDCDHEGVAHTSFQSVALRDIHKEQKLTDAHVATGQDQPLWGEGWGRDSIGTLYAVKKKIYPVSCWPRLPLVLSFSPITSPPYSEAAGATSDCQVTIHIDTFIYTYVDPCTVHVNSDACVAFPVGDHVSSFQTCLPPHGRMQG